MTSPIVPRPGSPVSTADLFVADDRPVLLDNGVLVPVGGKVLLEVLAKHVAVKHLAMNGEKWVVTYTPVTIDQRIISMLLTGRDPRTGEDVKGGTLASRVPKA